MSAELLRLFPEGMKHNEAERGKPRHDPPLRFVPTKKPDSEEGDESYNQTITVELNLKTTQKVVPYTFVDVESFLGYQKQHEYILSQQEAKANWSKLDTIRLDTVTKLSTTSPNTINAEEKASRKKLLELQAKMEKQMDALVLKAFTLYQQMSAAALRAEWDDIVQDHCFTAGWTDVNGNISAKTRGQDWTTLAECKHQHLSTVCDQDAAERHYQYMMVTLRKPQRLLIKPFYKRIKELDDLAHLLPCLKDQPDCPSAVQRMNVCMTPFVMCGLLMRSVNPNIEDEYNCLHANVPTDPKKLVEQLTRIETKIVSADKDSKIKSKADDRRKAEHHGDPPGSRSRSAKKRAKADPAKALANPIPRKTFPSNDNSKYCKLCKEYGGAPKTHKTSDCQKWAPGGNIMRIGRVLGQPIISTPIKVAELTNSWLSRLSSRSR